MSTLAASVNYVGFFRAADAAANCWFFRVWSVVAVNNNGRQHCRRGVVGHCALVSDGFFSFKMRRSRTLTIRCVSCLRQETLQC